MGANVSALVNPAKKGQYVDDARAREQLEVLLKLADARLDTYQGQLEMMFLDNAGAAKRSVPGKRALRFARYVGVNVGVDQESYEQENAPSESNPDESGLPKVTEKKVSTKTAFTEVDEVVRTFFNITPEEWAPSTVVPSNRNLQELPQTKRVSAMRGFAKVVSNGLKEILMETTSTGESTDQKFFVCIHHNAVIRIDVMTYRYNFNKVVNKETEKDAGKASTFLSFNGQICENIFGYVYCLSVVDHSQVTDDELVFLASEFAGDALNEFGAYIDELMAVWAKLRAGNPIMPTLTR
ncbi:unnamed protein product [Peniophora sp. CBMAI 1063]|nr:unnamed protein product [Peniophora sp. CBMAI 1063]